MFTFLEPVSNKMCVLGIRNTFCDTFYLRYNLYATHLGHSTKKCLPERIENVLSLGYADYK